MPALFVLAALLCVPVAAVAQMAGGVSHAVSSITPEDIRHRIGVIAHDSMRGRDTPSPELDEVAEYIAGEFQAFGLAPGGDEGSFLQRYPIVVTQFNVEESGVRIEGGPSLAFGADVIRRFGALEGSTTGSAVVLHGTGDPAALGEADLSDQIVFWAVTPGPGGQQIFRSLARAGPDAIVLISQRPDASWNRLAARQSRRSARVGEALDGGTVVLETRDATMAPILAEHGIDLAELRSDPDHPVTLEPLADLRLTVEIVHDVVTRQSAPNVVGVLEGSDPTLRHEYVVFSGHMDHVGVNQERAVEGDSIWNGADDDASGTIGVVELAEAFAMLDPAPKRSMIFLTVSGEERGLWGSRYFAEHSPVPIDDIVANMNLDMIGRNWPDTIVVIGKEHSDLGETLNRVNTEHPELGMTAIDDLWPEENFYGRSDHINFARRGVPILFFFNGTHEDYHGPGDEVQKIDAEKESRIVKLLFYLGLEVANAPERPQWDPASYREIVGEPMP